MKDGLRIIDCDLHVIEDGALYEKYLDPRFHADMPEYLGWGPTNFPHWDVAGQMIPPWARDAAVIGPQKALDAPSEDIYAPIRERKYDADSTIAAMDVEGIDEAVMFRTFASMLVSIDSLRLDWVARTNAAIATPRFDRASAGFRFSDRMFSVSSATRPVPAISAVWIWCALRNWVICRSTRQGVRHRWWCRLRRRY